MNDSLHTQSLASYLDRLPTKLDTIALNLDYHNPRVFLPLVFLTLLVLVVWNRKKWDLDFQKGFLLALVFADLMIFRMPLGNCFYDPSKIPPPAYPPPQNRSLVLLQKNVSPLPEQYGEMAYTNWNLVSGRPSLAFDANPGLVSYDKILKELGWFSWVYKDRDPMGFVQETDKLRWLGVDQIVSDDPLALSKDFKTLQDHYPFVYGLSRVFPKAFRGVVQGKLMAMDPQDKKIQIQNWGETSVSVSTEDSDPMNWGGPDALFLQKSFLPGWKALDNGIPTKVFLENRGVLTSLILSPGVNHIELKFEPVGLRLGFFLFFLFLAVFACLFLRRRSA